MILHNLVPIILHTTYWVQKIIKQTKGEVKIHCCLKHFGVKAKIYLIRFVLSHMKFTVQSSLNRKHEAVLTVGSYIAKYRWETMKKSLWNSSSLKWWAHNRLCIMPVTTLRQVWLNVEKL